MKTQIFRTGRHTDSKGITRDWTGADLDRIVSTYDPAGHEAPVVIGHPADNAPAYGWVEKVWREGEVLWAGIKNLVPEFVDLVKQGLFKKRSIALYPDLTLRHVGFLGAMPPAIKGLADVAFKEGSRFKVQGSEVQGSEVGIFEFAIEETVTQGGGKMTFKEFFEVFKFWKQVEGEEVQGSNMVQGSRLTLNPEPSNLEPKRSEAISYSEADLEAAKKQAAKEAAEAERAKATAEFAEVERRRAETARHATIEEWARAKVGEGKVLPSWAKSGLVEFMKGLDGATEIEFGEEKTKKSPYQWFKEFMEALPQGVQFKEIATRDKDVAGGSAAEKLGQLVAQRMKERQGITYYMAFAEVQKEHPDLAMEYAGSMRG